MLTCKKCHYEWRTRIDTEPKRCPACSSLNWKEGKRARYCPECPHCNPTPRRTRTPEEAATLARFKEMPDDPDKCCCRGVHRPDNPKCEANYKAEG